MTKKSNKRLKRFLVALLLIGIISAAIKGYDFYTKIFAPNVVNISASDPYFYIRTNATFSDVVNEMKTKKILLNTETFEWVAKRMKYEDNIKPGRYKISSGMNNKDLVSHLRSGKQAPVRLVLNPVRNATALASKISSQIEADSVSILEALNDSLPEKYGFNKQNVLSMFIPNTYEFYWNTSAEKFIERMHDEYKKFWSASKKQLAKNIGLTANEVSTLASIVEQETNIDDEKPVIAGVYMNRYKKGWKLEADPTLVYAANNFSLKRVLNIHKEIDSPYNTYMYAGLPPGPICIPSVASIHAVLNYRKHEYMYFCAKEDFSGRHVFAKDYSTHLLNAKRFHKELNRRRIL